jgi:hypothetical protein
MKGWETKNLIPLMKVWLNSRNYRLTLTLFPRNTRLTSELATTVTSMASRAQSRSPLATTPTRKLPEASSMFQANGRERIMQDFLRAAESQDIPVTDDLQDLVTG